MNPVIVGIVGGSGSGKTTLARGLAALRAEGGACIVSQDRYYRGLPAGVAAEAFNFDDPSALDLDLLAAHLRALRAGAGVLAPEYDFATHRRTGLVRLEPAPLVIVEGMFLFSTDALRRAFDVRLFLDVPADERRQRRVARDVRERGREAGDVLRQFDGQAEPMYRRHVLPAREGCHVVPNFPRPDDPAFPERLARLWERLDPLMKQRLAEGGAA